MATNEDLLKLKVDITEEQRQARHQQNNEIQKAINKVDDLSITTSLLSQSVQNMQDGIKEIKEIVKDISIELKDKYITKDEHKHTLGRISIIEKVLWSIGFIFISGIGVAILKLIIK